MDLTGLCGADDLHSFPHERGRSVKLPSPTARVRRFGIFELDAASGELRRHGVKIRLADQPFQILCLLLDRPGDVVTRQELRQRLWSSETFVDFDTGLNSAIRKLRDALDDSAENPRFIETLPRRGYRFIGSVQPSTPEQSASPATSGTAPGVSLRTRRTAGGGWIAACVLIGLAVALWERARTPQARTADLVNQMQVTFEGDVSHAALSPDGQTLAYLTDEEYGRMRLWVRDVRGGQPVELFRGSYLSDLEWLPDGSHLVVVGPGTGGPESWLVPRLGGAPRRLDMGGLDIGGRSKAAGIVAVSPDGSQLALANQSSRGFVVVPISGGPRRTVALAGFRYLFSLDWSPSTNRLVMSTMTDDRESVVWTVGPDGQNQQRVYAGKESVQAVCWSAAGDALYLFTGEKLVRVALADSAPSAPEPLLSGAMQASWYRDNCNVTADGRRLLHVRAPYHANLWRLDLSHAGTPATPLTRGTSDVFAPHLSSDDQWVAFKARPAFADALKVPLAGGEPIPLVKGTSPVWSPDGRRLAFVSDLSGARRVWVSDADGLGRVEINDARVGNPLLTWLPDGRLAWPTPDNRNYRIRDLGTGKDEWLMKESTIGMLMGAQFSPRGDQVVLDWSRPDDKRGLWTLSWPAREERFLVSNMHPDGWSPDGEWIYAHESGTATIVKVSVRNGNVQPLGTFPTGTLLDANVCAVTRDGRTIVCSLGELKADAWLLEHFDPHVRPSSR